jgi:hypothetical protein
VLTGFEGQQTIGVATVNGALCLLHTSHTPPDGLLKKTQSILARASDENLSRMSSTQTAELPRGLLHAKLSKSAQWV